MLAFFRVESLQPTGRPRRQVTYRGRRKNGTYASVEVWVEAGEPAPDILGFDIDGERIHGRKQETRGQQVDVGHGRPR